MDLDDLTAIAEKSELGAEAGADPLLHGGGLPLVRVDEGERSAAKRPSGRRPGRSGRGLRSRLHAALLRGPAGPGRSRRAALRARRARAGRLDRRRAWTAPEAAARRGDPAALLRAADEHRAREQRPGRARADRVVHRGRRLPGAAPRAPRDEPGAGRRGDHQERPARPRRRRLSRPASSGPRSPSSPPAASSSSATPTRATPAPSWTAASWRATRIACSRGWPSPPTRSAPTRATSTSAANIRWPSDGWTRPSSRPEAWACSAARSSNRRSTSGSTSASAPALSSAARRPR